VQGLLKGFDQTVNLILNDAHERVYSANSGVELVPLGLYIIRGDNVYVLSKAQAHNLLYICSGMIGEMDIDLDQRLDFANIKAPPLGPIWTQ
jgi:U6 snRNA-associated Sm-like protein LSm8